MEISVGAIMAVFTTIIGGFVSLFGWTLSQVNKIGITNAAMDATTRTLVARIDLLVQKLDANFAIQISEQVARNVLQEKVVNLERQLASVERAARPLGRRHAEIAEEDGT